MGSSAQTTLIALFFFSFLSGSFSVTLIITNNCNYPVWPVISETLPQSSSDIDFTLQPGESNAFAVPPTWSGRVFGRTLCSLDSAGKFSCVTGDTSCTLSVQCAGSNSSEPKPVTVAVFTLNGTDGQDLFAVTLMDGYNIPMVVEPVRTNKEDRTCTATGCEVDLNMQCPAALTVTDGGKTVACKSACQAFEYPEYCCNSGAFVTCKPNSYSEFFKSVCPRAYSYPYDNISTIFSCVSSDYTITFCPRSSSSLMGTGEKNLFKVQSGVVVVIVLFLLGVLVACTCKVKIRKSNRNGSINMVADNSAGPSCRGLGVRAQAEVLQRLRTKVKELRGKKLAS